MRNFLKAFSAVLVGVGLCTLPTLAQAQEITLRVEPGVAVPFTSPQNQRFDAGGAVAVKPELTLGHYIGLGPSLSYLALPSTINGVDTGTALGLGGFVRVKRPHDELNKGRTPEASVSPWVDADAQYVRTDPLDRFSWSVGAGAAFPTSEARTLWIGPFVRYQNVHEGFYKHLTNTNDCNVMIVGLSLELGARAKQPAPPPAPPPPPPPVAEPPPPPPPPPPVVAPVPVMQDVNVDLRVVVQFAWDSPVLDNLASSQLDDALRQVTSSKDFKSIKIEGHASSEGQMKHNDTLAQNRANSVLEYLAAHGVPREKLSAVGFGSTVPVADNKTEAGRVLNRRAEFEVHFIITKEVPQQ